MGFGAEEGNDLVYAQATVEVIDEGLAGTGTGFPYLIRALGQAG